MQEGRQFQENHLWLLPAHHFLNDKCEFEKCHYFFPARTGTDGAHYNY
jgi:hypothetical protein